jgi:hypothetical protein
MHLLLHGQVKFSKSRTWSLYLCSTRTVLEKKLDSFQRRGYFIKIGKSYCLRWSSQNCLMQDYVGFILHNEELALRRRVINMSYRNKTYVIFDGDNDMWAYAYMKGWKANEM